MADRTKVQKDANDLDMAMVRFAAKMSMFAELVDDAGLARLARQIRADRLGVRIHMHKDDREATR